MAPFLTEATVMPDDLQERFLKKLPRIEAHAKFAFRRVGCPHAREDLEAETIALAWSTFVRLIDRGKNPDQFITTLAMRCAQAVRSGRRVAGGFRKREAMPQRGTARGAPTRIPSQTPKSLAWDGSRTPCARTHERPCRAGSRSRSTFARGGRR